MQGIEQDHLIDAGQRQVPDALDHLAAVVRRIGDGVEIHRQPLASEEAFAFGHQVGDAPVKAAGADLLHGRVRQLRP